MALFDLKNKSNTIISTNIETPTMTTTLTQSAYDQPTNHFDQVALLFNYCKYVPTASSRTSKDDHCNQINKSDAQ